MTGSGQGIGAETARLFAGEGARVVVGDVDAGECVVFGIAWFLVLGFILVLDALLCSVSGLSVLFRYVTLPCFVIF